MLKTMRILLVSLTAGLLLSNAHAGLFGDDEARTAILDVRQRLEAMQAASSASEQRLSGEIRKSNDDNTQLRRSLIEISNQLEMLRADVAKLRGQNEQLARDVAQSQIRQKDLSQGVDERLRKIEPAKVTVDGKEFMAEVAETQEFESALALLRKSEFAAAQVGFTAFLKRYTDSGYKPSALFWLGNAQYALRSYRESIVQFRTLVDFAPQHMRAPEALLSIANCYVELKDMKTAKKTLEELVKAYPQSEAAYAGKERINKLKQLPV